MRSQQRKINRPDPALSLKKNNVPYPDVINHIRCQKNSGNGKRGNHESLVYVSLSGANRRITPREQHSAEPVENGVECGMRNHNRESILSESILSGNGTS